MVYSVDLSAAFDMLRKNTLVRIIEGDFSEGLRKVIYDFLSERKCVISIDDEFSEEFDIDLGCVQGSVLGPKLFNLYTRDIPNYLTENAQITAYADDAYVVISAPEGSTTDLVNETERCIISHVNYLRTLGMMVNQSKTEIIHVSRTGKESTQVKVGNEVLESKPTMNVLGIIMDGQLTWSEHIAKNINKLNRLTGALKFVRVRLTRDQFLQVLTSQYYSTCYYGAPAWLGSHTRKMDIRKLNNLHYRLLRTAVCDWKHKIKTSREDLDRLGRARPSLWAYYISASTAIKIIRDDQPTRLNEHLLESIYCEDRSGRVKFYDRSRLKQGRQSFANRLRVVFESINTPITFKESNASLRIMLKRELGLNVRTK